jgi:simple sugar transport system ATP-binding protein
VLEAVDFEVAAGEIHALLGENGAGKTTLMRVLVGLARPDAGVIELAGRTLDPAAWNPAAALRAGVRMVHQHSALVPAMTAVENLRFGDAEAGWLFRPRRAAERAAALAARFGLDLPLGRPVAELSPGERQRAEILRALARGARLLILDEPTAVLTPGESDRLFDSLRRLREDGHAVIFISHKLAEVESLADRVTILRSGRVTARLAPEEIEARRMGRLMLGRELEPVRHRPGAPGAPRLEIRALSASGASEAGRLRSIDLEVRAGEIVGVLGIDGNGQRELEEVLAGVRRASSGQVLLDGKRIAPGVRAHQRAGLAHLSGDRENAGLVPGLSLAENFILKGSYDDRRFFRRGWLDVTAARRVTREALGEFAIVPRDPDAEIGALSGGNAQKLAVARELDGNPAALVAVNPCRGLDVGSARFVQEQILARRDAGTAVLLISSEIDEVLELSDRVVALVRGRVVAVPAGADRAAIGAILLGAQAA